MRVAAVWCVFIAALMAESWIVEQNTMTKSSDEMVLINALEDAKALVEYLENQQDIRTRDWVKARHEGWEMHAAFMENGVRQSGEMMFRAMRIKGLLEKAMGESVADADYPKLGTA